MALGWVELNVNRRVVWHGSVEGAAGLKGGWGARLQTEPGSIGRPLKRLTYPSKNNLLRLAVCCTQYLNL